MNLGPHWGFIVAAYVVALVILAALIAWIAFDRRQLRRALDRLETQGIARRSERTSGDPK